MFVKLWSLPLLGPLRYQRVSLSEAKNWGNMWGCYGNGEHSDFFLKARILNPSFKLLWTVSAHNAHFFIR